jgi:hypothetical protein
MTQSTLPTRRALHAYPGPVGELVSREISAHMDALVRTGDTLVPGLVTQLLGLSPPDSHPHRNNGDRTTANAAEPHQNNRWHMICEKAALQVEYLSGRRSARPSSVDQGADVRSRSSAASYS